ncbi:MAG: hypothetical protein J7604_21645 [Sporocytophaga sp.]|uniref:hypothetical protein n=1 Tax=Sporocytophaga sp. TaxID=2231183 RepID=UPI001AFF2167|nr:hypothetical protein [Sporocytophaga sp.]MBO9702832.1 hypothetical protein [Sporocytophaga sp.]
MYSSNDEYIYEVIELYLSGLLPENERILFEEQLISDSALQHKMEVCKTAKDLILQNKLKGLKSIMAEEQTKADQSGPFNKGWAFLILLALIGSGSYLLIRNNSTSEIEKSERISNNMVSTERTPNIQQPVSEIKHTNSEQLPKVIKISDKKTDNQPTTIKEDTTAITHVIDYGQSLTPKENPLKADNTTNSITEPKIDLATLPANKCEGVVISAQLIVQEPCNGSNNGVIEIKGFKGGTSPYKTTLNGSGSEDENIFRDLNQGTYRVDVTDYNGCKHQFNPLILKGKVCKLDYDFNPGRGEEWLGPIATQASKLTIIDKTGNQVYSKQMTNGEQCTWSGYSESGKLESGYFIYIIENRDGKVIKGSITVTE